MIVPTLREAENIQELLQRIARVRSDHGLLLSVIVVDDDSGDGIGRKISELRLDWVALLTRRVSFDRPSGDGLNVRPGLANAVLAAMPLVQHPTVVVMDADLSHPPGAIPALLRALDSGAELAIGSRFCPGGSTDARWTIARRLNSALATLLARRFTRVRDPMSGMLAFDREFIQRAGPLRPIGYKLALELIVRSGTRSVVEVPIAFRERSRGSSKLSARVRLEYLVHLLRLARVKRRASRAAAGGSG